MIVLFPAENAVNVEWSLALLLGLLADFLHFLAILLGHDGLIVAIAVSLVITVTVPAAISGSVAGLFHFLKTIRCMFK